MKREVSVPEWIDIENDVKHVGREKKKAKELRNSQWWKQKLASGICHYCGKKFPPEELTMDHIVPLSRGGRSTKGNIVSSCRNCNQEKKYYTPVEFILDKLKEDE
jgi:5-methylcytosine-specific restriction endonuclease McrA